MEIKGKVIQNLGIQSGTSKAGKAWNKASIVIETEGQYPKKVALDNLKNAEEFAKLTPGIMGTFHIEVSSNEFNGRWYTSVNCYKWEVASPYPQQQLWGQPFNGTAPTSPVNTQSATSTLDAMGVKGYQGQPAQTQTAEDSDLPF